MSVFLVFPSYSGAQSSEQSPALPHYLQALRQAGLHPSVVMRFSRKATSLFLTL